MRLPETDELEQVTAMLAGPTVRFHMLNPEQRATVVNLAIQAEIAEQLYDISCDMSHVSQWFEKSRLFEGL